VKIFPGKPKKVSINYSCWKKKKNSKAKQSKAKERKKKEEPTSPNWVAEHQGKPWPTHIFLPCKILLERYEIHRNVSVMPGSWIIDGDQKYFTVWLECKNIVHHSISMISIVVRILDYFIKIAFVRRCRPSKKLLISEANGLRVRITPAYSSIFSCEGNFIFHAHSFSIYQPPITAFCLQFCNSRKV
jgi:hypothetical protein